MTAARRAVVTGAAGFIGSNLCEALLADGWLVTGIDHLGGHPGEVIERNLATLVADPRFVLVPVDLVDAELGPLLRGADTVFHLAARPGVRPSWSAEFADYTASNVLAAQRLLDAATRAGVRRVVVSSSSSVYGGAKGGPSSESSLPTPLSPYGATKWATEQLGLMYGKRPDVVTSVVALRYFTVYGPRQRDDMAISRIMRAALTGEVFTVFGDGRQVRDFTYVSDAVAANLLAAQADVRAEVVNVGTGETITVLDLIDLIGEVVGRPVRCEFVPASPGDARETHADVSRAAEVLGYHPSVDLPTGLKHHLEWMRSLPELDRG